MRTWNFFFALLFVPLFWHQIAKAERHSKAVGSDEGGFRYEINQNPNPIEKNLTDGHRPLKMEKPLPRES